MLSQRISWLWSVGLILGCAVLTAISKASADLNEHGKRHIDDGTLVEGQEKQCQDVRVPLCKDMLYNETVFPNLMGHATQDEARLEAHTYVYLVKSGCSPALKTFLCLLYAPVCTSMKETIPPCRNLCETTRAGCEKLMNTFGFSWPENLDCSRFPDSEKDELCVPGNNATTHGQSRVHILPYGLPTSFSFNGSWNHGHGNTNNHIKFDEKLLQCPADWHDAESNIDNTLEDCGLPCTIFTTDQKRVAGIIVIMIAAFTFLSSFFTMVVAVMDPNRFQYPERTIVHLAVCYAALSICYIIGAIWGNDTNCSEGFIVHGPKHASCTLLFMFTYFCTFASHMWWVLLSFTWYLSAGLKWGNEAICAYSLYFHLGTWGASAFLTLTVVALGYVEGDPLAGPCSLGIQRATQLQYFMFYPLMILISVGTLFFVLGFLALFRIRREIKRSTTFTSVSDKISTGGHRTLLVDHPQDMAHSGFRAAAARLEILMARIGVFSVLYTVPATVFLASLYCLSTPVSSSGVLSSIIGSHNRRDNQTYFNILLIRYISNLAFGCALVVWVGNRKTLKTLKKAFCGRSAVK